MRTHKLITVAGVLSVLSLGVFAGFVGGDDDEGVRADISVDQALQTALSRVNGYAMHAETEREGSAVHWCVVIADANSKLHEVEIHGTSGQVLEVEEEDDEGPAISAPISMAQAISTARGKKPGYVTEAELENEKNVLTWGVEVIASDNKLYEVEMNANTGEVIRVVLESDDNDGDGG